MGSICSMAAGPGPAPGYGPPSPPPGHQPVVTQQQQQQAGCVDLSTGPHQRQPRVLAMGNTIIDTVFTMAQVPVDDKVWVDSKRRFVGGQGANAAQGMAKLGITVFFLTRLGDDDDGTWAKKCFDDSGIDTRHCIVSEFAQTMSACVVVGTAAMTRVCLMHKDPKIFAGDLEIKLGDVDLDFFDAIYTDGHQMDMALPVIRKAASRNIPIVADVEVVCEQTRELAELASELIAPAAALKQLSGLSDVEAAVIKLANVPGKVVVATAGEKGSFGARHGDDGIIHVPVDSRCQAFDTTGAGDAFHAGYTTAMTRGVVNLEERMLFATSVAGALCESPGPVPSAESLHKFGCLKPVEHSRVLM